MVSALFSIRASGLSPLMDTSTEGLSGLEPKLHVDRALGGGEVEVGLEFEFLRPGIGKLQDFAVEGSRAIECSHLVEPAGRPSSRRRGRV